MSGRRPASWNSWASSVTPRRGKPACYRREQSGRPAFAQESVTYMSGMNRLWMERATGFEPATSTLGRWHSATELRPPVSSGDHFSHASAELQGLSVAKPLRQDDGESAKAESDHRHSERQAMPAMRHQRFEGEQRSQESHSQEGGSERSAHELSQVPRAFGVAGSRSRDHDAEERTERRDQSQDQRHQGQR